MYFKKQRDALAHEWLSAFLSAFHLDALLPHIRWVREVRCLVLLVASLKRNQMWFPELIYLLSAAPWQIPLRTDLLSQARGMIYHPQPELWSLHVWHLNGNLYSSPQV